MDELEDLLEEMQRDNRTPEQKARSEGYTEGYLACEAEQRRKAGLLEKFAETPISLLWSKMQGGEPLDSEEAVLVWRSVQITVDEHHTDGSTLLLMYDRLNRELTRGERCSVCGRYKAEDCATEC